LKFIKIAGAIAGIFAFVWTVIQILDYFGIITKSAPPTQLVKNNPAPVVAPKDMLKTRNFKSQTQPKQDYSTNTNSEKGLKVPVQVNSGELSGSCSYTINNSSSISTRFTIRIIEKQSVEREIVRVFLPSKSTHTVTNLPEGIFSIAYCIGKDWDSDKNNFNSIKNCKDTIVIFRSEVEKKLVDGDIIKKKKCGESISIKDVGQRENQGES
jgi:hypothetical protein